ncbi:hypothetical protein L6452_39256 [Arctium lappa]|uniref:Uncharacterized protein n=1 Tax=Arctium lappa TaxID=4217 RepID=A0ACB8XSI2_ARCLA|nr:hypothetical protein L6452_39256 [Arctium lappa]
MCGWFTFSKKLFAETVFNCKPTWFTILLGVAQSHSSQLFKFIPVVSLVLQDEDENSECFSKLKSIPDGQVLLNIPGDYSRKPPIGELLAGINHFAFKIQDTFPAHTSKACFRSESSGWQYFGISWTHSTIAFP